MLGNTGNKRLVVPLSLSSGVRNIYVIIQHLFNNRAQDIFDIVTQFVRFLICLSVSTLGVFRQRACLHTWFCACVRVCVVSQFLVQDMTTIN